MVAFQFLQLNVLFQPKFNLGCAQPVIVRSLYAGSLVVSPVRSPVFSFLTKQLALPFASYPANSYVQNVPRGSPSIIRCVQPFEDTPATIGSPCVKVPTWYFSFESLSTVFLLWERLIVVSQVKFFVLTGVALMENSIPLLVISPTFAAIVPKGQIFVETGQSQIRSLVFLLQTSMVPLILPLKSAQSIPTLNMPVVSHFKSGLAFLVAASVRQSLPLQLKNPDAPYVATEVYAPNPRALPLTP